MIFCTLFDSNYLDKGLVMYRSLKNVGCDFRMYILAMDEKCREVLKSYNYPEIIVIPLEHFVEAAGLAEVRTTRSAGEFCWTCTSFLIHHVLAEFKEVNLFLRGIVPMIGYKTGEVYYDRAERFAGESKYPLRKMLAFAMDGITSLSVVPIRMITALGTGVFLISMLFLIWGIVQRLRGATVPGWSSIIVSVWAIGGLILLSLGVLGEYIGRIYLETKGRPRFMIDEYLSDDE